VKVDSYMEERLRAAADDLERMADGTGALVAFEELGPELATLLRDAADAYRRAWAVASRAPRGLDR
jgi:hypothetical protein